MSQHERDGYMRVGDTSDFIEPAIGMDEANMLREIVAERLLIPFGPYVKRKEFGAEAPNGETYPHFTASRGVQSQFKSEYDLTEACVYIGAHVRQHVDNRWHLTITENQTGLIDGVTGQRVCNIFKIICWDDQVMEATRKVKIARAIPALIASDNPLTEDMFDAEDQHQRIYYTKPMLPKDCAEIAEDITKHAAQVTKERAQPRTRKMFYQRGLGILNFPS